MLTTTYALVAISMEQKKARSMLEKLEKNIPKNDESSPGYNDLGYLKLLCTKLIQFDQFCRARKVEVYIIPAIRKTTVEMDGLLNELELLSSKAIKTILSLFNQMQSTIEKGTIQATAIYSLMECYCQDLVKRFNREEKELFPIAERLLSFDQWFAIAVGCLSEEAESHHHKLSVSFQDQDFYEDSPIQPFRNAHVVDFKETQYASA